jgi:hypothetical protein
MGLALALATVSLMEADRIGDRLHIRAALDIQHGSPMQSPRRFHLETHMIGFKVRQVG